LAGRRITDFENFFREEAIMHCGAPANKNAVEMENQVFLKAKSKVVYLACSCKTNIYIAKLFSAAIKCINVWKII